MSEQDGTEGKPTEAVGKPEAEEFLRREFVGCRERLAPSESGLQSMRQGQSGFDEAWATVIRNATRLFGKSAVREALKAMGRSEDVTKMY
jgi:hypothetical protein